jgi:hypothetical protein
MNLFSMTDALLRDRDSLYQTAAEGKDTGKLCAKLLVIFVITSALYGAAMGCFRWIHPEYVFSDFALSTQSEAITGRVAGIDVKKRAIYAKDVNVPRVTDAEIRFNTSRPTDPYKVASIGEEKGYTAIVLAPGSVLCEPGAWRLPLLVALKTPLLFVLTLLICAPALYVLNLAFGMRLHFMPAMMLMAFALSATGTMLGVFIPIVGLFTVVTESYHFMKVFHLLVFVVAGLFGVKVLGGGLIRLAQAGAGASDSLVATWFRTRPLLLAWLLLYCLVGAQLAWTLKPFLGTPYLPATPPFRFESGNIYVSFFQSLAQMSRF